MKDSYRISKIMKKLFRQGFADTFLSPDVSEKSREYAATQAKDQSSSAENRAPKSDYSPQEKQGKADDRFERYQREYTAYKLAGTSPPPKKPGNIIKLPLDFPKKKKQNGQE